MMLSKQISSVPVQFSIPPICKASYPYMLPVRHLHNINMYPFFKDPLRPSRSCCSLVRPHLSCACAVRRKLDRQTRKVQAIRGISNHPQKIDVKNIKLSPHLSVDHFSGRKEATLNSSRFICKVYLHSASQAGRRMPAHTHAHAHAHTHAHYTLSFTPLEATVRSVRAHLVCLAQQQQRVAFVAMENNVAPFLHKVRRLFRSTPIRFSIVASSCANTFGDCEAPLHSLCLNKPYGIRLLLPRPSLPCSMSAYLLSLYGAIRCRKKRCTRRLFTFIYFTTVV